MRHIRLPTSNAQGLHKKAVRDHLVCKKISTPLCLRKDYTKKLFEITVRYLSERGLMVKGGTIVEATIIDASASTKNQKRGRDRQMGTTKKGNQWYIGMKAHVGTDTQGRVHSVAVTSASKHDSTVMEALLHGEEEAVYGDKAYASAGRQAEARGVVWRVSRKGGYLME